VVVDGLGDELDHVGIVNAVELVTTIGS